MKKLFSFAILATAAFAIYRNFVNQQDEEAIWQEATRDYGTTPHPGA